MNTKDTPTWKEFDAVGAGTENQIYQLCRSLHMRVPEYVTTASENHDTLLSIEDAKNSRAKTLITEGEKLLKIGIDGHEDRVIPAFRENMGNAMKCLLNANDIEPNSVEIMAKIAKTAETIGYEEISKFWLIRANAAHLGMLK